MRQKLIDTYLDWWNNYASIGTYADHNGLTFEQAKELIDLARKVYNSPHPDE